MCEYKSIPCIKKMGKGYQDIFDEMVKAYAEKLSSRIILSNSAFTLHDFDHHCFNIYKIISYVLFNEELVYKEDYGLSQRELLILNLAVLFHDIGMSEVLGVARENHSVKSAEFIQREYDDANRPLRNKTDLTISEIKALKAIVVAHSNIKDGSVSAQENGLYSHHLKDYPAKNGTKIRTKFLAGVLRLADELDVSSERLGTGEIEQQIEEGERKFERLKKEAVTEGQKREVREWEGYIESHKHWKKLHLISNVQRNEDGETIELCVDDEYIERSLDEGNTEKSLSRDLVEIYLEVETKLQEAIKLAFVGKTFRTYVYVKKVELITQNKTLDKEIQDKLSVCSLTKDKKEIDQVVEQKVIEEPLKKSVPRVINPELEKIIFDEVNKRNLIKFGHYLLNEKYCARDWIDTQEVVETKVILNKVVEAIVKDINSKEHKKYIIVGVDLVGALLASRVAFSLQSPLSYIVPEKDENNNANQEIELNIEEDAEIILVTDAIVTYDTIHKAVSKYALANRIDSIYTIFFRQSDKVECKSVYLEKTHSINNAFYIELYEKEKCMYNKNKCIARNQKINKGEQSHENN